MNINLDLKAQAGLLGTGAVAMLMALGCVIYELVDTARSEKEVQQRKEELGKIESEKMRKIWE